MQRATVMRLIQFQAFIYSLNKILPVQTLRLYDMSLICESTLYFKGDYELMQATGKKDNFDQLLFDADLFLVSDEEYVVVYNSEKVCFYAYSFTQGIYLPLSHFSSSLLTKVGNMYLDTRYAYFHPAPTGING